MSAIKAAVAIRRNINPAGLLSGSSFSNKNSERKIKGKRITSSGIDSSQERKDETPIPTMRYASLFLEPRRLIRKEKIKKSKRPNKIRNLSTVVRSSGPTKSNPPAASGLKDR
jgi:hypothetical protein